MVPRDSHERSIPTYDCTVRLSGMWQYMFRDEDIESQIELIYSYSPSYGHEAKTDSDIPD